MPASRRVMFLLLVPTAVLIALQLVPYGRDHSTPPDGDKPDWNSVRTVELAKRACYDCHSNETKWPWYSNLAPVSWRIFSHVEEGREKLNFSALDTGNESVAEAAGEAGETVAKKTMPPADYLLAHPEARLTAAERKLLAAGLDATFAAFSQREGKDAEKHGTHGDGGGKRGKDREPHQEDEHEQRGRGGR